VEAIRRQASTITARDLHRRVPEPATNDEIARLAATMNKMLGRLEAAQANQHRFISDASHELRSPVASLKTAGEVALAYPLQRDWPDVVRDMLVDAARLESLVAELLDTASLDENPGPSEDIELGQLVATEVGELRSGGIEVDMPGTGDTWVRANRSQLRRLIRNLLDNAVRHATHRVAVGVETNGTVVAIHVDDDGPGIPIDQREYVFERFGRLDEARSRDAGGVGLGLAMAKAIVERFDGSVGVGDAPVLGGARLSVTLPVISPGVTEGAGSELDQVLALEDVEEATHRRRR
jgi:signal transduction histidine kinase